MDKPKILMMDEATANIDEKTDQQIQALISNDFNDVTVLTIAHRLNTIIQYDKLLVLSDGKLMEFDTPAALIQKEGGYFRSLVMENGKEYLDEMVALIKEKKK